MSEKQNLDKGLIKALQKGDVDAFDRLFDKYGGKILFLAKGYLGSHDDAKDLVQDVFIKIWKNRKNIKEHLSFRSYLFTITYNSLYKAYQIKDKEEKSLSEFQKNHVEQVSDPYLQVEYSELVKEVNKVVEILTPRQKDIFRLSREKGLSHKEIAELLSLSPRTVEVHIHDSIKQIKEHLKKMGLMGLVFFTLFL